MVEKVKTKKQDDTKVEFRVVLCPLAPTGGKYSPKRSTQTCGD